MKIPEKYCRRLLYILLISTLLALISVLIDFIGLTGNKGLSERGLNTLILSLIFSPLIFITLLRERYFSVYCKYLNYLLHVDKLRNDIRAQYSIRIFFLMSLLCAIWCIVDWVGITNSGLDAGGVIAIIIFCLLVAASFRLIYLSVKRRSPVAQDLDTECIPESVTPAVIRYSGMLILVLISFFLLLKLPGNVVTSILMLVQIWAILMLLFQIFSVLLRVNRRLRINMFLSTTVFMTGILLIELFLRFVVSAHATYLEKNGFKNYISLYDIKREGARNAYVERYYVHKPYIDNVVNVTEFDYKLKTNSLGLRNGEISLVKDTNELRIICLGDSFTEGFGADEDQCWPRILERELSKSIKDRKINLINAGIAGSDVVFEYTFLNEQLLRYSPDMVIVCLNTSDIYDIIVRGGFGRFRSKEIVKYKSPPVWEPVYARSHIFRHIIHDFFKMDQLFIPRERVNQEMLNSVQDIDSALYRFKELSEKHKFSFVTIIHPFDYQINDQHNPYSILTSSISRINGLHYQDLLDYFKGCGLNANNKYEYYWKIDKHYNAKGYYLLAKGIEKYLFDSGLLNKKCIKGI